MIAHSHEMTLGLAFGLGALHALEPGHGKTAMLVYLGGERRTWLHPFVIGLSSALAHSISLIAVAAAVHLTHHLVTGDHDHENQAIAGGMQLVSAALVIGVGFWMMASASRAKPRCGCAAHRHQCGEKGPDAGSMRSRTSYSMSALLGVAFGLLPCPSALAAYFSSMSTGAPVAAYAVIGLFAAGIATSLTLLGILVQTFGNRFFRPHSWFGKLPWPQIHAGLVVFVGLFYVARVLLT